MRFRLIDESTDVGNASQFGGPISPAVLAAVASALMVQLNRDVATYWGGNYVVSSELIATTPLAPGEIACLLVDSLPNAPGAVAYHDVNGDEVPIVLLARTQCNSLTTGSSSVSMGLSHELLEAAGDPYVNAWRDDGHGREYAQELCDAVQEQGYTIDGITVSNFVFPPFFAPGSAGPFDMLGTVTQALQTTGGAYQLVRTAGGGETQVTGKVGDHRMARKRHFSSRTFRRGARL